MKKNVFLIINSLYGGGAEHVASRLSKEWQNQYNLYVISLEPFSENDYEFYGNKITINTNKGNWLKRILKARKEIDKLAKKYKPDTMISFLQNASLTMLLTKYKCKKIISIRNYLKGQYSGKKLLLWETIAKTIFHKADYVVSVSKKISEEMVKEYGIKEDRAITIYNPYEISEIEKKANEELDKKEKNFYKDSFVISNVGHLSKQKGQIALIEVVNKLKNDNVKAIIVGSDEKEYAQILKNKVKEYGIEDKVLFTGRKNNPYKFVANSNLYVFPSLFEGFPNALVEAMVCGVPVLASNCISGPQEILNDTINEQINELTFAKFGLLMPNNINDSEKFIIEAIELLNNKDIRIKDYIKKEKDRIQNFKIEIITKEWKKII